MLADGKLADQDTDDFSGFGCWLQGTPLGNFCKSQAIQGLNHVGDGSGRTNEQDFNGFALAGGYGGGFRGNMNRRCFAGVG